MIAAARRAAAASAVIVEIIVESDGWPAEADLVVLSRRTVAATLLAYPRAVAGSEVSITFTDDERIARLNRSFRGKDNPTNVLSFPVAPPRGSLYGPLLGDIVVARETIGGEAEAAGLTFVDHLTHLLVHGLLHLLGHDHVDDHDATRMESLETAILAGLGIDDPYEGAWLDEAPPHPG